MKGDVIYPKNCIKLMPWWWRVIVKLISVTFDRRFSDIFDEYHVELMARDKNTGGFVKTPWFLDENSGADIS